MQAPSEKLYPNAILINFYIEIFIIISKWLHNLGPSPRSSICGVNSYFIALQSIPAELRNQNNRLQNEKPVQACGVSISKTRKIIYGVFSLMFSEPLNYTPI